MVDVYLSCMVDTPIKMERKEKEYNNPTNALRSVLVPSKRCQCQGVPVSHVKVPNDVD